jgi:hypothetical protein
LIVDKNEMEIYHLDEEGKYQLEKTAPTGMYTFNFETGCAANILLTDIWQ